MRFNYFKFIETLEGEIAYRISRDSGYRYLPFEVIRRKYEPDFKWLWRRTYLEIQAEHQEHIKLKENQTN